VGVADLAHELHQRVVQERTDLALVVGAVGRIHLRGDLERQPHPPGHRDGQIGPLLRGDPPQERQVAARPGREGVEVERQPVGHRADPANGQVRERSPLGVADGHHRHIVEPAEDGHELRQVQASVQRVDRRRPHQAPEGECQEVHVAVNDVEVGRPLEDLGKLDHVGHQRVAAPAVQAQRALAGAHQGRGGARVPAGEERHPVAPADQFLGEPRHHPFGAAVERRGDTLVERRDLGDPQGPHRTRWVSG